MSKASKYSLKERWSLYNVYERFLSLESRERLFAMAGVLIVLCLLVVLPFSCASMKLADKEESLVSYQKEIDKLLSKLKEFKNAQQELKRAEMQWEKQGQIQLVAALKSLAKEADVTINPANEKEIKPTKDNPIGEQSAQIRLSKVSFQQVIDYLYLIENYPQGKIVIKEMTMIPIKNNRQQFDVILDTVVYSLFKENQGS